MAHWNPWSTLTSTSMRQGCTPKKGIMGKAGLGSNPGGAGCGVIIIPPVSAASSTHHIFTPHLHTTLHLPDHVLTQHPHTTLHPSPHHILTPHYTPTPCPSLHFTTHTFPTTSHHTCLPPCVHNGHRLSPTTS